MTQNQTAPRNSAENNSLLERLKNWLRGWNERRKWVKEYKQYEKEYWK